MFWFGVVYDTPRMLDCFLPVMAESESLALAKVKGIYPQAYNVRVKYPS